MTFIWQRPLAGYSQSSRCSVWAMPNRHDQAATCIPCSMGGGFVIKMSTIMFVKYKHGRAPKACNMIRINNQITCC